MYNAELEAKKLLESLSDEEFIHLLQESGFEVSRGNGELIFTEDNEEYKSVVIGKVTIKFNTETKASHRSTRINSFPSAC